MVSVIVPVYNVEKYLDRCVQSICEQSYTDLEIILVDDGSPDNCPAMCDAWAIKDKRIKVIHKENGGLSDARNVGLKNAIGEYITFVDSDDWLEKDYCKILLKTIMDNNCDIAGCCYRRCSDFSHITQSDSIEYTHYSSNEEMMRSILENKIKCMVWNKMYRKELISNIPFPKGKQHEDEFCTYKVFSKIYSYWESNYIGYNYFKNPVSIMGQTTPYTIKRLDIIEAKSERVDYIVANYPNLSTIAHIDILDACIFQTDLSKQLTGEDKKNASKLLKMTYKKYYSLLNKEKVSKKKRLILFLARINLPLCVQILKLI